MIQFCRTITGQAPLVDGAKPWSRGVKVLYGESAEKQERVADELGMDMEEGSP